MIQLEKVINSSPNLDQMRYYQQVAKRYDSLQLKRQQSRCQGLFSQLKEIRRTEASVQSSLSENNYDRLKRMVRESIRHQVRSKMVDNRPRGRDCSKAEKKGKNSFEEQITHKRNCISMLDHYSSNRESKQSKKQLKSSIIKLIQIKHDDQCLTNQSLRDVVVNKDIFRSAKRPILLRVNCRKQKKLSTETEELSSLRNSQITVRMLPIIRKTTQRQSRKSILEKDKAKKDSAWDVGNLKGWTHRSIKD